MNVLYINHTVLKSGAGISLATLLRHLPAEVRPFFILRSRCEIAEMLGAAPERTFLERWMVEFTTTRYVPAYPAWLFLWHLLKTPLVVLRLGQLKKRWSLDLVHLNETTLCAYALAARLVRLPVVIHARTALARRRFTDFLLRRIARQAHVRFIAIDGEVKKSLPSECQVITEIIYNPIDLGPSPAAEQIRRLRESWGCTTKHVIVGQVASLHSQKGIWLILELAEKLCAEFPLLKFVLPGDDSPQAGEGVTFREQIKCKGLQDSFILPGYDSRLAYVYAALDVALCLFAEGLGGAGRAAYEAALAGKPLIATLPDPNHSQTLRQGVAGLVYSPGDRAGILDGLRKLIVSPELRYSLGTAARTEIGERHNPVTIANQVMEVYQNARG